MKSNNSYWLIGFTSLLLLALLVNQVVYVYNAANEQEKAFNAKVSIVLEIIENKIAENTNFCNSIKKCMFMQNKKNCSKKLRSEEDWKTVNHIIQQELKRFKLNLNYNFDFCNLKYLNNLQSQGKKTYTKNMDKVFQKAGVIMYLEFPEKSKYIFLQIGSVFFSSVLFIVLISLLFIITFRYYQREKMIADTIKDFLNNMMHEFKTPLTNISFANNMIVKNLQEDKKDKISQYNKIIQTENNRIIQNCNDILEFAREENILSTDFNTNIDIHQIIKAAQESFPSVPLQLELNAKHTKVKGKSSFMYNALSNLIDNAIKYCETEPKIIISTKNDEKFILISIKDNGIGIAKNKINLVFDKFYRIQDGDLHNVKGFGLGLAYTKLIVEKMNGKITLESSLKKGSTFIIKLPLSNE